MPSPLRNMINGGRRGRPLACLSDITAWASGGRGGGRTSFPLPKAFIARRKLKQPNTLSELDSFLQRQQFNDCVTCNNDIYLLIAMYNT